MESFFHPKGRPRPPLRYATPDEARPDLFACIDGFYNPRRLPSTIGYLSPVDRERMAA